jgi:hypothetical protein
MTRLFCLMLVLVVATVATPAGPPGSGGPPAKVDYAVTGPEGSESTPAGPPGAGSPPKEVDGIEGSPPKNDGETPAGPPGSEGPPKDDDAPSELKEAGPGMYEETKEGEEKKEGEGMYGEKKEGEEMYGEKKEGEGMYGEKKEGEGMHEGMHADMVKLHEKIAGLEDKLKMGSCNPDEMEEMEMVDYETDLAAQKADEESGDSTAQCANIPMEDGKPWHDSAGEDYSCTGHYGAGPNFSDWYCKTEGNEYAFGGMTANKACCACGGGKWKKPNQVYNRQMSLCLYTAKTFLHKNCLKDVKHEVDGDISISFSSLLCGNIEGATDVTLYTPFA